MTRLVAAETPLVAARIDNSRPARTPLRRFGREDASSASSGSFPVQLVNIVGADVQATTDRTATRTGSPGGVSRWTAPGRACQAKTSSSGASTVQLKVCTIAVTTAQRMRAKTDRACVPARS